MTRYPKLYIPLRSALQCLYSLPRTVPSSFSDQQKANEFLMHFQNRNLRRKRAGKTPDQKMTEGELGSTWIACVMLLCADGTEHAERLFAAQTILSRLRRVSLVDSVDIEMEVGLSEGENLPNLRDTVLQPYRDWMSVCNPLLFRMMDNHSQLVDDEERTKGEISALTLSGLSFLAASSGSTENNPNLTTLLDTIGNALATTALRIRYTSASIAQTPPRAATPIAVIVIMSSSLTTAFTTYNAMHGTTDRHALNQTFAVSMGGVPDLLSPGGVRGFLSVDPKCLNLLSSELRNWDTGIRIFYNCLQPLFGVRELHGNILTSLEKWVTVLPIPKTYIDSILPILKPHFHSELKENAFQFATALFESAQIEADQIVVAKAGMLEAAAKESKKKASRRRKRWQEKAKKVENVELVPEAKQESYFRKDVACYLCSLILDDIKGIILLEEYDADEGAMVWGCASACVGSCLPHLVEIRGLDPLQTELFLNNLELLLEICTSCERGELMLGYEPLIFLYSTVLGLEQKQVGTDEPILKMAVENIYQCVMALATSCAYPADYFDDLAEDGDEELENIRGDIREVIRAVTSPEKEFVEGGISIRILEKIVIACSSAVSNSSNTFCPESVVHTLSALAKPLFILAKDILKIGDQSIQILTLAITTLGSICQNILSTHQRHEPKHTLPIVRLVLLATSAYSPLFNSVLSYKSLPSSTLQNMELTIKVTSLALNTTLKSIMQVATLSLQIPELPAPSLGTIYDIRGAMRGPGGDDHVGCLALKRLTSESDDLMEIILGRYETVHIYNLYQEMKKQGFDGKGTTPRSRRILVGVISRLGIYGMRKNDIDLEPEEISSTLQRLVYGPLEEISQCGEEMNANEMYKVSEACFELAACTPEICGMLFNVEADFFTGVQRLIGFGISGYSHYTQPRGWNPDLCLHWGRLRAALLTLFRSSCNPTLPDVALDAVHALNKAECEAVHSLFTSNVPSSAIFKMSVIGDDLLPSGAFVRVIGEVLDKISARMQDTSEKAVLCRGVIDTMVNSKEFVLNALMIQNHVEKEDLFLDPRPTLAEAWYLALETLIKICNEDKGVMSPILHDERILNMVCESCSVAMLLWLTQHVYQKDKQVIMNMDGPHTVAMFSFLEKALTLGNTLLNQVGTHLRHKLQLYIEGGNADNVPSHVMGGIIIESALLRGLSGGFPPWALESMPEIHQALFNACGADSEGFFTVFRLATQVKLWETDGLEGLEQRSTLTGDWVDDWSQKFKADFFENIRQICYANTLEGWRKIKTLVKAACGGTKIGSYGMKPPKTSWNCGGV